MQPIGTIKLKSTQNAPPQYPTPISNFVMIFGPRVVTFILNLLQTKAQISEKIVATRSPKTPTNCRLNHKTAFKIGQIFGFVLQRLPKTCGECLKVMPLRSSPMGAKTKASKARGVAGTDCDGVMGCRRIRECYRAPAPPRAPADQCR